MVHAPDVDGKVPLYYAITHFHVKTIRVLLSHDASKHVNFFQSISSSQASQPIDDHQCQDTFLHVATENFYPVEILDILINDLHLPVKATNCHRQTPLHTFLLANARCARSTHVCEEILTLFVAAKFPFSSADIQGKTIFHYAAMYNQHWFLKAIQTHLTLTMTSLLVARQDKLGRTPLLYACAKGHISCVHTLLELCEKPFELILSQDRFGQTPLHIACYEEKQDVLALLLEASIQHKSLIQALSMKDCHQRTCLHHAAMSGNFSAITSILNLLQDETVQKEYVTTHFDQDGFGALQLLPDKSNQQAKSLLSIFYPNLN
eukprot:CAMPEP_0201547100 /NCGR_PEP_ID=MMETSP0173_2-20130828/3507_1 /ASSEMBLY_ACC=CAM_ASM_000268 /TAXON_ID=218659 /ORGANISM="Vexillifera sp., Strain DIVA3 564/2" /LENGTH=319 /DNA_ID=CAMNT_0047956017 /DNA_START=268 /DNA_END=1224 /DNA_ORIENTATION=+